MRLGPLAPLDHMTVQAGQTKSAVNATASPVQNMVGPEADTIAASGKLSTITGAGAEAGLSPQPLLMVAV